MNSEQRENLEVILPQSALAVGSDVSERRRLLRELSSAQPLPRRPPTERAHRAGSNGRVLTT